VIEDVRKEYKIQLCFKTGMKTWSFNYSCEIAKKTFRVKVRDLSLECSIHFGNKIVSLWLTPNCHYSRFIALIKLLR